MCMYDTYTFVRRQDKEKIDKWQVKHNHFRTQFLLLVNLFVGMNLFKLITLSTEYKCDFITWEFGEFVEIICFLDEKPTNDVIREP